MRYLVFSDIHANLEALRDILKRRGGQDQLVCCGDICGFGKDAKEVIEAFAILGVAAVAGNHDRMITDVDYDLSQEREAVQAGVYWAREHLFGPHLDYLAARPETIELPGLFVKHTLGFDDYIQERGQAAPLLEMTEQPNVAIGHTHVPVEWLFGSRRVFNPGSITKGRRGANRGCAYLDTERGLRFESMESLKW